tara:strand:- start:17248 stop:17571 length:324 start_codon:yes stop_codon:yes gene_type:complete
LIQVYSCDITGKSTLQGEFVENLELELKELIISTLQLEDLSPEEIDSSEALFVSGLGLDSIDALELGVAIKKKYNVKMAADDTENHKHFASVNALAEFVRSNVQGVN